MIKLSNTVHTNRKPYTCTRKYSKYILARAIDMNNRLKHEGLAIETYMSDQRWPVNSLNNIVSFTVMTPFVVWSWIINVFQIRLTPSPPQ